MTQEFSRYVNARWLPFLFERVVRYTRPALVSPPDSSSKGRPFDYRGRAKVSEIARLIAERDRESESATNWTRMIRRWINEGHAPAPETVRRVLEALGFDWAIGLGASGYRQHAIAMLHSLWAKGSRSRVAAQARATFPGSDYQRNEISRRSLAVFTSMASRSGWPESDAVASDIGTDTAHLKRLNAAAEHSWGVRSIVPMRCTPPPDLPASPQLYVAWMLLDSALTSRTGFLEQRLRAVDESVTREVEIWAQSITPPESILVPFTHSVSRKKKK
jgi:hypothetical protein